MAKKKAVRVNKSLEIREFKKANRSMQPKEIAAALAKKDIEVTPQFVSMVLSNAKKKKGVTKKAGRPKSQSSAQPKAKTATRRGRPPKRTASNDAVTLETLLRFKEAVSEVGGVENARTVLSALETLAD